MRQINYDELYRMAVEARSTLEQKAYGAEHENIKIYLHWTAGWYDSKFDDYHINIDDDGGIWASTDELAETLNHTWRRNSGAIGIALCCAYGATTEDLGATPPTTDQIEAMAKVIATICHALELPINKQTVLTHGEAADNEDGDTTAYDEEDCYGPKADCERWDLEYLGTAESPKFAPYAEDGTRGGDVIRGKANWYLGQGY